MIQGKMFILYLKCLRSREDKRELSWFKASLLLMSFVFSFLTKLSAAILFFFHAEITEKKKHKTLQNTANTHFAEPKYNPADNICIFYITFALIFSSASGLDTPVELKLKLIPMLQHMHHDASLASSSRELLQHLVNSYPSTPMVIVSLHTFTQLAASSLIDIPKQVDPTCSHTAMPPFFRFVVVNL